jgi:mRNA-degrading endonuclease RelE of RelBE toxin-antitoxin system
MTTQGIRLKPSAIRDMDRLKTHDATRIADGMEQHLAFEPTKESKSRIKRLKGISDPDYRLRLGDYRVFYNVVGGRVDVLRVMHKKETYGYYEELKR